MLKDRLIDSRWQDIRWIEIVDGWIDGQTDRQRDI